MNSTNILNQHIENTNMKERIDKFNCIEIKVSCTKKEMYTNFIAAVCNSRELEITFISINRSMYKFLWTTVICFDHLASIYFLWRLPYLLRQSATPYRCQKCFPSLLKLGHRHVIQAPPTQQACPRLLGSCRGCPDPLGREGQQLQWLPELLHQCPGAAGLAVQALESAQQLWLSCVPTGHFPWQWRLQTPLFHLSRDFLSSFVVVCLFRLARICFYCLQLKTLTLIGYGL